MLGLNSDLDCIICDFVVVIGRTVKNRRKNRLTVLQFRGFARGSYNIECKKDFIWCVKYCILLETRSLSPVLMRILLNNFPYL